MLKYTKMQEAKGLGRREFLKLTGVGALALVAGCAKNPVTGESQFMLVSEEQEIALDKQASPYQFSNDYGAVQDAALNKYVSGVGMHLASTSHRPQMPYNFRCLNATYVNAYAFPGGSVGVTRAIMLQLENEAELAALLGHEIGHVNARHTAERMSKQQGLGLLVGLGSAAAGAYSSGLGSLVSQAGGFGASALLASYSRDDERQADALGMEYMFRGGYDTEGMVGLMEMLNAQHKSNPSALEVMFSTHPMSSERLTTARAAAAGKYATSSDFKMYKERYMDNTASLRRIASVINSLQKGGEAMGNKKYDQAETHFQAALKTSPKDYAGLLMLSKCCMVRDKDGQAVKYAVRAKNAYPQEPQALLVAGLTQLRNGQYEKALVDIQAYDKKLPNPYMSFFTGLSKEKLGRKQAAAEDYYKFLQKVKQGDEAKYAYSRLVEWGYIRSQVQVPAGDPYGSLFV
ncbi:M48 family metalloprotease [Salidesulfovibrio onnuriiensis]|uniref:M48 family metalloprotease n=1 Tax=Salidesulfovibrio onnuriiensis TaxID=2583823 RepID=UPI00202B2D8B|nr:M48 family metalloprotease [Salidesulfovibrio onnuriiensis]